MWLYDKALGAYVRLVLIHSSCFIAIFVFKPESCEKMKFFEEEIF